MRSKAPIFSVAAWQRLLGALLLLAVLASQSLGLLHRYVHFPGGGHHSLHVSPQSSSESPLEAGAALNHTPQALAWVAGLFSAHTVGSAACLGFDACIDSVPIQVPLGFVAMPVIGFLLQLNGLAIARWHAQFQARGPPISH